VEWHFLIIDRHIIREILRPFVLGLGLLVLVFIGYAAAQKLTLAAAGQLGMATAFKLIGLNTLITLEVLLPSALFFSALAAIGGLYRDSEMVSLYAAGVSRARVLYAVFKLALVVALITGVISTVGRPWAYRQSYALEAQAAADFNLKQLATGEFLDIADTGYVFYAGDVDRERGLHQQVFLRKEHRKQGRTELIVARAASLPLLDPGRPMQVDFYDGYNYLLDTRQGQDVTFAFNHLVVRLPVHKRVETYRRKAETTATLAASTRPKDIAEFQWRVSTPLATVLLALIAVPLARSAPRQSRFRNFFLAIMVYIGLFSVTSVLRTAIEQERLGPVPGLWTTYVVAAVLLVWLVRSPRMRSR
jgi:lipopolysaccharide export system permease protein